jgi:hypothetical protein
MWMVGGGLLIVGVAFAWVKLAPRRVPEGQATRKAIAETMRAP